MPAIGALLNWLESVVPKHAASSLINITPVTPFQLLSSWLVASSTSSPSAVPLASTRHQRSHKVAKGSSISFTLEFVRSHRVILVPNNSCGHFGAFWTIWDLVSRGKERIVQLGGPTRAGTWRIAVRTIGRKTRRSRGSTASGGNECSYHKHVHQHKAQAKEGERFGVSVSPERWCIRSLGKGCVGVDTSVVCTGPKGCVHT